MTGNNNVKEIYRQQPVPVIQNRVYETREDALKAKTQEVVLAQCPDTGFIFSADFSDFVIDYDAHYQNEQSNSPVFRNHLEDVIHIMEEQNTLSGKVIEIGCGKAFFLNLLLEKGIDATGMDPTYEGESPAVIKDFFSEKYSDMGAELIILRHTLEHISDPFGFIKEIAKANNGKGKIYIEVPTFDWILEHNAVEDIFYEHCNYFTLDTLQYLFNKSRGGYFFNGQYIWVIADLADVKQNLTPRKFISPDIKFEEKLSAYRQIIAKNPQPVIWGAGAKGSTFLNLLDKDGVKIKFVVDINPKKQGRYTGGTGHKVIPPDELKNADAQTVIAMNSNYIREIEAITGPLNINVVSL